MDDTARTGGGVLDRLAEPDAGRSCARDSRFRNPGSLRGSPLQEIETSSRLRAEGPVRTWHALASQMKRPVRPRASRILFYRNYWLRYAISEIHALVRFRHALRRPARWQRRRICRAYRRHGGFLPPTCSRSRVRIWRPSLRPSSAHTTLGRHGISGRARATRKSQRSGDRGDHLSLIRESLLGLQRIVGSFRRWLRIGCCRTEVSPERGTSGSCLAGRFRIAPVRKAQFLLDAILDLSVPSRTIFSKFSP